MVVAYIIFNTKNTYGLVAKIFHWLSALLILGLFSLGVWMVELDYEHAWYDRAAHYHESVGICFVVFMVLRVIWSMLSVAPEVSFKLSIIERFAARWVHRGLYFLCGIVFLSGYLIPTADGRSIDVFSWFSVPAVGVEWHHRQADMAGDIHFYAAYVLMLAACFHGVAALKHHFIDRDNTLKKML